MTHRGRIWTLEMAWHLDAEMAGTDSLREAVAFLETELDKAEATDDAADVQHALARLRHALATRERRLAGP